MRPCASRSAIHAASFTSLLRPGTLRICAAFANVSVNVSSSRRLSNISRSPPSPRASRRARPTSRQCQPLLRRHAKGAGLLLNGASVDSHAGDKGIFRQIESGTPRIQHLHDPGTLSASARSPLERSLRRVLQAARRTALHRAGWRTSRQVREIDVDAVATICGARGALGPTQTRAHSTKEKPTSVPMRRDYRLFRSHAVSSAGEGLKPPSDHERQMRIFVTRRPLCGR